MDQSTLTRIRALVAEIEQLLELEDEPQVDLYVAPIAVPDEITIQGIIGRPEFTHRKGRPLWTAGVGVNERDETIWYNIAAWNDIAQQARAFGRGQVVQITGSQKTDSYVGQDGTLKAKTTITVRHMSGVASSATTP